MSDKFPLQRVDSIADYCDGYLAELRRAAATLDRRPLAEAATALARTFAEDRWLHVCGNGGSAAIANHLRCDHSKGIGSGTALRPRVASLSDNVELLTAIANDLDYADVFVHQLASQARAGDTLLAISSSGDSENIVRALDWAVAHGLTTISLTGFSGGRAAERASISLHVASTNYGVVEDLHQSIMHVLAQYLRQQAMTAEAVAGATF